MAYQGDPVPKGPGAFENAPLTPEDLERLATAFRPSWELDEAPFTGAGALSAAEVQALQGGGTHADVRAATQLASSAFPPARTVAAVEPVESIVVAQPAVVAPPPAAPAPPAPVAAPWSPPVAAQVYAPVPAAPQLAVAPSPATVDALAATRIVPRRVPAAPPIRARVESVGSDMVRLARPSRKPLWIGLGALAMVAAGVGAWASMSPSTDKASPSIPAAAETASHAAPDFPAPSQGSDWKAVAAATATTAPGAPAQAATSVSLTPLTNKPSTPPPPAAAAPQATAAAAVTPHAAPAPAPRPYVAPAPAPAKPAARPKSSTIVHDVPF
jgi:hypothetical protein